MKNLFKNRIFIFILGLLIPIVIVAMIVYFFGEDEEVFEMNVDDFTIEDNTIVNEKEGLMVTVPDGWIAEKDEQIFENTWGIRILDPVIWAKREKDNMLNPGMIDSGCMFLMYINKSELLFKEINSYLTFYEENLDLSFLGDEKDFGIIKIKDNQFAWKDEISNENIATVDVPLKKNDRILQFIFFASERDKEFCYEEFNNFLKKLEIRE